MRKIIALVNHKGGVGKSTSAHNLGKALVLQGLRVLLIDNDPQANLTTATGIEADRGSIYHALCEDQPLPLYPISEGFHLVPSELEYTKAEYKLQTDIKGYFKMKRALQSLTAYDYILIDCPPSLGILTLNALIAADSVMIIAQSSYLSAKGLQTILDVVEDIKEELNPQLKVEGFLLTQLNNTVIRKQMGETIKSLYEAKVFETVIRQNVALEEASAHGKDIFDYAPDSYGAKDYMLLAEELLGARGLNN
ncbi:ParA family protein [Hugenholtzia roseola]|uniref:ParA family protein n=1 Tax=Hugenholtzia roseola TaxID=1002 RepID=UPI000402CAEB|nr:ParA family protein [Hugenholtzia roseola]